MKLSRSFSWIDRILRPEQVFLWLGSVFGLLFCAASVPFMVPDEFAHFYRAYQISQNQWLPVAQSTYEVGGELPESFHLLENQFSWMITEPSSKVHINDLIQLLQTPLEPQNRTFFSFKNTAIYSPMGYLPQALGLWIGRLIHISLLGLFYLGRIFNLFIWLGLTWAAIRTMPILKWALLALALMPMTISQAASHAVDGLLTGLCFLYIARIARAAWDEMAHPNWREIVLWGGMLAMITLCKPAYLFLGMLVLLVPARKYGSRWRLILALLIVGIMAALAYLGWMQALASQGINMATTEYYDPAMQSRAIQSDPLAYGILLFETIKRMLFPWVVSAIGYFGWLNQPQPPIVYPLYILFAFLLTSFDNHYPGKQVRVWQRFVSALVIALHVISISTSVYVISHPVNYKKIEGIQGRYFIPMGILLSMMISNQALRLPAWAVKLMATLGSTAFLIVAILTVGSRIQF